MRAAVAIFILAAATGGAHASSFVTLAPVSRTLGPSMILLGPAPQPAAAAPSDELPRLAFPLGGLADPVMAAAPDAVLPPLAFPLGSLDTAPAEAKPRLAFPLGSLRAGPVIQLSPSVIAIGAPAVTGETVAALQPQHKSRRPAAAPRVMRGGEVGGAFPGAATAPAQPGTASAAPAPATQSRARAEPKAASAADRPQATPGAPDQPEPPAPAPAPPIAPPPGMAPLRGPE